MRTRVANAGALADLAALVGVDGAYEGAKIALCTNVAPIQPADTIADITEATYAGYARSSAVTFGTPHLDSEGNAVAVALPKEFKPNANGAEVVVTQIALVDAAGTGLLRTAVLDEPITFSTTMDVHLIGFPVVQSQPADTTEDVLP